MNVHSDDIGLFDFGQTFRGNVPRERPAIPKVLIQQHDLVGRQAIAAFESFIEVKATKPSPIVDVRQRRLLASTIEPGAAAAGARTGLARNRDAGAIDYEREPLPLLMRQTRTVYRASTMVGSRIRRSAYLVLDLG
jgi:hypothetical protein